MTRLTLPATILACLATAALVAASAPARPAAKTESNASGLQKDLDALVAAGAPGAILFVRDGDRITSLAAGLGDIAGTTPMRTDNHFKIASLTKTYTATVVLQLVGEGKLSLDDTVERRLPGVVPNGGRITIRQLLNHTSGLADFESNPRYLKPYLSRQLRPLLGAQAARPDGCLAQAAVRARNALVVLEHELRRRPADRREDHRETARRRAEAADLPAARARQTSYPTKPGLPSPYAHGYRLFGELPLVDVTGLSPSLAPGSGAIVSTVRDVADFYRALLAGRLLEPEQLKAMKTTCPSGPASPSPRARDTGSASDAAGSPVPQSPSVSRAPAGAIAASSPATTSVPRSAKTAGARPC